MSPADITPAYARLLEQQARRVETPCGDGAMVWRGWGEGDPPLLLLHGGAGSWVHWVRNIETLAQRHTVWVPDLPGMGASAQPPDPWTPESLADILAAGLRRLPGGSAPLHVVGFSFGGLVAGHLAARHPELARSLTVVDAAGIGVDVHPGRRLRSWRKVTDPMERRAVHRHNLGVMMLHDLSLADDTAVDLIAPAIEADRLKNRGVSRTDSLLQALQRVRCPVHGIWGEEDALYQQTRPELDAALRAANLASLLYVPGAGHWAQYEKPDRINAALLDIFVRHAETACPQSPAAHRSGP